MQSAEVTNTFGDRHSYLCNHPDLRPITPTDRLKATKIFHVSPFQPIDGTYEFRFDFRDEKVGIWIDLQMPHGGVMANLIGTCKPLRNRTILGALLRRPFGSRRVLGLIHWQAFKLWLKGAKYRARPEPPKAEVSWAPPLQLLRGCPISLPAMLGAAGLLIYIHAPKFFRRPVRREPWALGAALFILRLSDFIQDPLGKLAENQWACAAGLGGQCGYGLGHGGLFAITPPVAPVLWLAHALLCFQRV